MLGKPLYMCALVGTLATTVACGSGREVEVTGEVSAPASAQVQGEITIDFMDVVEENQAPESVHTAKLATLGAFSEKVSLEGSSVLVRAINDKDGNGACSAGEAWAEKEMTIKDDDTVDAISLALSTAACPAVN